MTGGGTEECTNLDINPGAQSSPECHSPPSFGEARGSDNDSYYQRSEHVRIHLFFAFFLIMSFYCFQIYM